jgi:hypothetical protein
MELQRIQRITNDQILYNVGFEGTVTGESPITDNTDTIQDINTLFLWNVMQRQSMNYLIINYFCNFSSKSYRFHATLSNR